MRVPRLQIDMQHIQRKPSLFSGDFQSQLHNDSGILAAGKGDVHTLEMVENVLQTQTSRSEHVHVEEMLHTVCSISFRMAFRFPFSLPTSRFSSSRASAFLERADRMRSSILLWHWRVT